MKAPPLIPVGQEPPPLRPSSGDGRPPAPARHQGHPDGAKGRPVRRKTGDRFAVANAFADYGARLVDATAQAVWWILWRDTRPEGLARTSQKNIGQRLGVSDRTVRRALQRLEKAGLVKVVYAGGFRRGPAVYRIRPMPDERIPQVAADSGGHCQRTRLSAVP